MQQGISVIICCYNSSSRLPATLQYLSLQQTLHLDWEVIVVDNASTDNTAQVAHQTWSSLNRKEILFTIVTENKAGLSFARQCGVNAARHEHIIFCDDDNWLNADYLQTAYNMMHSNKSIGALGGFGLAVSDGPLPEWFGNYEEAYAVGKQAQASGCINHKGYVNGAGMVTRKSIFNATVNKKLPFLLSDRQGNALTAGGDCEYCLRVLLQGYNICYDERLVFKHYMPQQRLTENYRKSLFKAFEETHELLHEYIEAARIQRTTKSQKLMQVYNACKDLIKSILRHRKIMPSTRRTFFYFFNMGYKNRMDFKMIRHFYNSRDKSISIG